jgi:hypothetical protein
MTSRSAASRGSESLMCLAKMGNNRTASGAATRRSPHVARFAQAGVWLDGLHPAVIQERRRIARLQGCSEAFGAIIDFWTVTYDAGDPRGWDADTRYVYEERIAILTDGRIPVSPASIRLRGDRRGPRPQKNNKPNPKAPRASVEGSGPGSTVIGEKPNPVRFAGGFGATPGVTVKSADCPL